MHARFHPMTCVAMLMLCGCPLGTPRDHYRPHGHQDTTISISPTDDAILFNAAGTGGRDLYLLDLTSLKVMRIAETPDYETAPSFSRDGQRIVYAAGIPGERADHIFTIGRDGSSKRQLTHSDANDTSPRLSPDGNTIVFARDKTYNWGGLGANWEPGGVICVVGVNGTGERQLTPDDGFAFAPLFTQDGQSVIYFRVDGCFSVPTDGSEPPKQIGPLNSPANLSPSDKQFVYANGKYSGDYELFIANLDGTGQTQITSSSNGCFHPVFANRDERIFFIVEEWPSGLSGAPKSSIWTVKADGTEQRQITDLGLFDAPNHWRPQLSP